MIVLALILALVVAFRLGKDTFRLFIDDSDDFRECARYSFTPDIFSLFRGKYFEGLAKSSST